MNLKSGNEAGEDLNVREVHGQILRERDEPSEDHQRVPWWLKHLIYAPLVFWAIWYLAYASGGFKFDVHSERFGEWRVDPVALEAMETARASSSDAGPAPTRDPLADGATAYAQVCAACHQADGRGLAGAFPPLAGSNWVTGDERRLVLLTLHGLMGPIVVNGEPWNGAMPAQGATLDDAKIAAVLSYIRNSWGNNAPTVDAATVRGLREQFADQAPWTAETLDEAVGGL
jgi:mono/diheme cytochrome c family protein